MLRRVLTACLLGLPLLMPAAARAQNDGSFNLVNRSGQIIREVYASPVTQQTWGDDRLGNNVLAAGRSLAVRMPPGSGCQTDIRVVFADSRAEERRDVNTCQMNEVVFGAAAQGGPPPAQGGKPGAGAAQGQTGNPSFNLVNNGARVVRELYATPVSQGDWGADLLGAEVVGAGARFAVRLREGPCDYDIRVVWADGQAEERRAVNLCSVADVVFQ